MRQTIGWMGIGAIVIVLLLYLFPIQENHVQKNTLPLKPSLEKKDVSIKYTPSLSKRNVDSSVSASKHSKSREYIVYKTADSYRKYDIYVVSTQDLNITDNIHSNYKKIFGTIGLGKFVLKIPDSILDKKIDILVVEKKNKNKSIIDATSLLGTVYSLTPEEELHIVIDPSSPQNYTITTKQKSSVLPFVP